MAVEKYIENGNRLRDDQKELDEAIAQYDLALKENPKALKALTEKSIALQRQKKFDEALVVLKEALALARARANRTKIALVYFRLFTIYYARNDLQTAVKYLNAAEEFSYSNANELQAYKYQLERKIEKQGLQDSVDMNAKFEKDDEILAVPKEAEVLLSPGEEEQLKKDEEKRRLMDKMGKRDDLFPNAKNIRLDWFQSTDSVTVSLFVKNLPKDDSLKIEYRKTSITIEFPTSPSSEFQYSIGPLFAEINPESASHRVFSTKLELYLPKKSNSIKWKTLESANGEIAVEKEDNNSTKQSSEAPAYPSSAKNAKDWSKINVEDDEEAESEVSFFQKLYQSGTPESQRAMMKSFIESNGTALSTDWNNVKEKQYETMPPDGMVAREWNDSNTKKK